MSAPVRIHRKRTKGWKMPPNTVYVGRPSKWGNPWRVEPGCSAELAVTFFRRRIENNRWSEPNKWSIRAELRGKNLACWCPLDQPCHADVLEIANGEAR